MPQRGPQPQLVVPGDRAEHRPPHRPPVPQPENPSERVRHRRHHLRLQIEQQHPVQPGPQRGTRQHLQQPLPRPGHPPVHLRRHRGPPPRPPADQECTGIRGSRAHAPTARRHTASVIAAPHGGAAPRRRPHAGVTHPRTVVVPAHRSPLTEAGARSSPDAHPGPEATGIVRRRDPAVRPRPVVIPAARRAGPTPPVSSRRGRRGPLRGGGGGGRGGHLADVVRGDLVRALEGRQRPGGPGGDHLPAVPHRPQLRGDVGAELGDVLAQPYVLHGRPRRVQPLAQRLVRGDPVRQPGGLRPGLVVEAQHGQHHRPPRLLVQLGHGDHQPEAVEQLGPQTALLGVHRPDQTEADAAHGVDGLALHRQHPRGDDVEDDVDDVVVQQVDLVDVQHPLLAGLLEQPRLRPRDPCISASSSQPPSTRSSVALIGRVTGSSPRVSSENARTTVDLAVPRCPLTRTPPIRGAM